MYISVKKYTEVIRKIYQYAEPNLSLVGWMGFIGYPVYYLVWDFFYPQPFESIWLRTLCSVSLLVLAMRKHVPLRLKRFLPIYYVATIALCLPFFFWYMLLMNDWSTVWAMSFMSSIFLHILLVHDTRVMFIQVIVSILGAYLIAGIMTDWQVIKDSEHVLSYVPVFVFTYVFGNLFYFRNQVEHEFKVSIAKSFGAGIAHEMRNPLSALKSSVDLIGSHLPIQYSSETKGLEIPVEDVTTIKEVLQGADETIRQGNEAIDLLLTSIDQNRVSQTTFTSHSIQDVVEQSLHSYAYKGEAAKRAVSLCVADDFEFFGSDILLKYALYNLLKNALYYQTGEDFRVKITLSEGDHYNYLYFEDNGVGIEPNKIEHIFEDFYTSGKSSSYGLGLPFCLRVMTAFGGGIECSSELGKWTHFALEFPKMNSVEVADIKESILASKSALYVGRTNGDESGFYDAALLSGMHLEVEACTQAAIREEFEFEFDLIVIDLDCCTEAEYLSLESKLHFTEARIVLLYSRGHQYHDRFSRFITIYPIDKSELVPKSEIFDELFFGTPKVNRNDIPNKKACSGKQVLIVDDNESIRTLTTLLLTKQGFNVLQASDGQQALNIISRDSVDLVLMDLEMPVLDGFAATESIRNAPEPYSKVPVIGHTGDNEQETVSRIKQVGMNDYLIKPVDKDKLLDKISMYI